MVPQPAAQAIAVGAHGDSKPAALGLPAKRGSNTKESTVSTQPIGSVPLVKESDNQSAALGSMGGKGSKTAWNGSVGKGSHGKGSSGKGHVVGASSSGKGAGKVSWGASAIPSSAQRAGGIKQLRDMGFTEEAAKDALTSCVWDVNKALDMLLSNGAVMCPENAVDCLENKVDHLDPESRATIANNDTAKKIEQGRDSADSSTTASDASTPRSAQADAASANSPTCSVADTNENSIPHQAEKLPCKDGTRCLLSADGNVLDKDVEDYSTSASDTKLAKVDNRSLLSATEHEVENNVDSKDKFVEKDGDESKLNVSDAEVVEQLGKTAPMDSTAPVPTRQLARVTQAWHGDDSNAGLQMLSVHERELLHLLTGSETENGWVFAEQPGEVSRAGWVPLCVLMKLGTGYQIMHVDKSCDADHQTQLSIRRGMTLLVNVASLSEGGWVYVELAKIGAQSDTEPQKEGWVPIICLK